MTDIKLDTTNAPRWIHVKPEEPETIYLGGDLEGMNYTIQYFPVCVTDPRLFNYPCIEDFILEYIETELIHESCHIAINMVDGSESSELWDNVDRLNEVTGDVT